MNRLFIDGLFYPCLSKSLKRERELDLSFDVSKK